MGQRKAPRIAIVGGGIGGLSSALFLKRAGFEVDLFEQAPEFGEVGAGIQLAPNAVRLLNRIGLEDRLRQIGVRIEVIWDFRRYHTGERISHHLIGPEEERIFGAPYYMVHRAELLKALTELVPKSFVHLGLRCVDVVEREDAVALTFDDGSVAEADVVIGADGIHSAVRNSLFESPPPVFSGYAAYRGVVPIERAPSEGSGSTFSIWMGPDRHFVHYPISAGRLLNYVAIVPADSEASESWSADGSVEKLLNEFTGWHPLVQEIVASGDGTKCTALNYGQPLPRWVTSRVALSGDAAHPMLPFVAQGACQAIEDAAALAVCLADQPHSPGAALARYEALRMPRAGRIQQMAKDRAVEFHLPDGAEQRSRDERLAQADPLRASQWIYTYDAERELAEA